MFAIHTFTLKVFSSWIQQSIRVVKRGHQKSISNFLQKNQILLLLHSHWVNLTFFFFIVNEPNSPRALIPPREKVTHLEKLHQLTDHKDAIWQITSFMFWDTREYIFLDKVFLTCSWEKQGIEHNLYLLCRYT